MRIGLGSQFEGSGHSSKEGMGGLHGGSCVRLLTHISVHQQSEAEMNRGQSGAGSSSRPAPGLVTHPLQ